MAEEQLNIITTKQAKKQINHLGRSLILYIIIFSLIRYRSAYIYDLLEKVLPSVYDKLTAFDMEAVHVALNIGACVLVLIPFSISSLSLRYKGRTKDQRKKIKFGHLFELICVGIALILLTMTFSTLFYFFFHTEQISYSFFGSFNTKLKIIQNGMYAGMYILAKPICEEIIFRGIIQRHLGHYGRYFGVLGSAVLFSIAQLNLVDAVTCFVIGWYLALVTLEYHSIMPSVVIHISLNLFLWVLNVVPGNYLWAISIVIILIYICSAIFLFNRRLDTRMVRYGATEWKLWRTLLTSSTTILCIILFIANVVLSFQVIE